mmetsp:Transcript_18143/g.63746  ORF Transcript_18143/g.63746 Transcript_18143/m.63746 type:complete len:276 (+) Transcript_18143:534-1361(+)
MTGVIDNGVIEKGVVEADVAVEEYNAEDTGEAFVPPPCPPPPLLIGVIVEAAENRRPPHACVTFGGGIPGRYGVVYPEPNPEGGGLGRVAHGLRTRICVGGTSLRGDHAELCRKVERKTSPSPPPPHGAVALQHFEGDTISVGNRRTPVCVPAPMRSSASLTSPGGADGTRFGTCCCSLPAVFSNSPGDNEPLRTVLPKAHGALIRRTCDGGMIIAAGDCARSCTGASSVARGQSHVVQTWAQAAPSGGVPTNGTDAVATGSDGSMAAAAAAAGS